MKLQNKFDLHDNEDSPPQLLVLVLEGRNKKKPALVIG
jgi:hypothetical protein